MFWNSQQVARVWTTMEKKLKKQTKNRGKNHHFFQHFHHNKNNLMLLWLLKSIANSVLGWQNATLWLADMIFQECAQTSLLFSDPQQRSFHIVSWMLQEIPTAVCFQSKCLLRTGFVWAWEWKKMTHILHLPGSWICPSVAMALGGKHQSQRKMTQVTWKEILQECWFY